jgi:7-carboxy-7-deazaguanine synthase
MSPPPRAPHLPVTEIFGPTIQGEGPLVGLPTHFIRLWGCDFRCSWCDSLYAVLPAHRREAIDKAAGEIAREVLRLPEGPEWVTISGGNPALYDLAELVQLLHEHDMLVAVETQGTRWREWLADVDQLVVSPKPPSSGMHEQQEAAWPNFLEQASAYEQPTAVKIVVFDEADYEWAVPVLADARNTGTCSLHLSVGTDTATRNPQLEVLDAYTWLAERMAGDPRMYDVSLSPQMHVLAWGHERGR